MVYEINVFFVNNKFKYKKSKFNLHLDFYEVEIKNKNEFKINKKNEPFSKINYSLANYNNDLNNFFNLIKPMGIVFINMNYYNFKINIL